MRQGREDANRTDLRFSSQTDLYCLTDHLLAAREYWSIHPLLYSLIAGHPLIVT